MLEKDWKRLKNGSDIRGTAIATEGHAVDLTDEVVYAIAAGFATYLLEKTGKPATEIKVAVGHDSRLSAARIQTAVMRALTDAGFCVFDCALMSTPAMFMTTVHPSLACDGAVQITASHLPFDKNGLKFFTPEGGLEGEDIDSILKNAREARFSPAAGGKVEQTDFLSVYASILVNKVRNAVEAEDFDHPLKGFKVVVDAGNGAGGFYAYQVLMPLGADITGSQFLEPDGHFPNHIPNPENAAAMASISQAVLAAGADLGLIFDTDVDRAGAVDSQGNEVNRNRLIALISAILLEEKTPAVIVTDSITSSGLKKFIENHGGMHHRFKRGYKNVINEAIRLNKEDKYCPLAIETSGHAALKENYFLDDGAYLVTKLLIKAAQLRKINKKLEDLLIGLEEPAEGREFRMNIAAEDFKAYGQAVIDRVTEAAAQTDGWNTAPDNHEGIRVSFDEDNGNGWFLLRLSLHEPLMPLNIESDVPGGVKQIAARLYPFLKEFEALDTTALQEFAGQTE